jgi:hypothetical protein
LVLPNQIDPFQELGRQLPFGNIAAAGKSRPISFGLIPEISPLDLPEIINNRKNIFLAGYIKYTDIFGTRHITGFCAVFHAGSNKFRRVGGDVYNYIKKENAARDSLV